MALVLSLDILMHESFLWWQRSDRYIISLFPPPSYIVQELCESRGGRPGLSVLTSLLASADVKFYWTMLRHWSQLVPNMSTTSEDIKHHFITEQFLAATGNRTRVRTTPDQTLNQVSYIPALVFLYLFTDVFICSFTYLFTSITCLLSPT